MAGRITMMGLLGGTASAAALAAASLRRGGSAAQPMNATSHSRHGAKAAAVTRVDQPHTATGFATHQVASLFWAALFEPWLRRRQPRGATLLLDSVAMATIAAGVDYLLTPKRFTPGWELVLPPEDMAAAYAAMALGFATGARLSTPARH